MLTTSRDTDPGSRDSLPRDVEVHHHTRALFLYLTPELWRLGVTHEDMVRVHYQAAKYDAAGKQITRKRIVIEAIE